MGKIIGVLNQKGGVGKSTICTHLAMSLYHGNNFKKSKTFVSIFDTDYPQLSIHNWREWELKKLNAFAEEQNYFYENKLSKIYTEDFTPINIYKGEISELKSKATNLKEIFNYTFVDVVGTVNTEGYDLEFLKMFDVIVIPTSSSFEAVRSTLQFVQNLIDPLSRENKIKYSLLINDVPSNQSTEYEGFKEDLKGVNYNVFNTVVNTREKYGRQYLDRGRNGVLSTLFPAFDAKIDELTEELIKLMEYNGYTEKLIKI